LNSASSAPTRRRSPASLFPTRFSGRGRSREFAGFGGSRRGDWASLLQRRGRSAQGLGRPGRRTDDADRIHGRPGAEQCQQSVRPVWSRLPAPPNPAEPEPTRGAGAPDPRLQTPGQAVRGPGFFLEPGVWSLESLPPCARFRAEGTKVTAFRHPISSGTGTACRARPPGPEGTRLRLQSRLKPAGNPQIRKAGPDGSPGFPRGGVGARVRASQSQPGGAGTNEGCRGSRPQAPDPRSGLPRPRFFLEPGVWSLESLPPCARFIAEGTIHVHSDGDRRGVVRSA
jgi:hypothetical protein